MPGLPSVNRQEVWKLHAACRDSPPGWWYPETGTGLEGQRVCAACPVRPDCLQHALADGEVFGTWGGASERVRRHLRALLSRSPHPTAYQPVTGCSCGFCMAVVKHEQRMRRLAKGEKLGEALNTNGPGAQHETSACYPKGCRRPECLAALRESRRKAREARRQQTGAA